MSDAYEQGYQYVLSELQRGVALDDIRQQLIASGWTPQDAATVIQKAYSGSRREPLPSQVAANTMAPNGELMSSQNPSREPRTNPYASSNYGTGSADSNPSRPSARRVSAKAVFLLMGGTSCFLIAFGLLFMIIVNGAGGKFARGLIFLIIIGGAMLKNGFDALNNA